MSWQRPPSAPLHDRGPNAEIRFMWALTRLAGTDIFAAAYLSEVAAEMGEDVNRVMVIAERLAK